MASLRMIKAIEGDIAEAKLGFVKVMIDYKAKAEMEIEIERRRKRGITDVSDFDPNRDDVLVDLATADVYVKEELQRERQPDAKKIGIEALERDALPAFLK